MYSAKDSGVSCLLFLVQHRLKLGCKLLDFRTKRGGSDLGNKLVDEPADLFIISARGHFVQGMCHVHLAGTSKNSN